MAVDAEFPVHLGDNNQEIGGFSKPLVMYECFSPLHKYFLTPPLQITCLSMVDRQPYVAFFLNLESGSKWG